MMVTGEENEDGDRWRKIWQRRRGLCKMKEIILWIMETKAKSKSSERRMLYREDKKTNT